MKEKIKKGGCLGYFRGVSRIFKGGISDIGTLKNPVGTREKRGSKSLIPLTQLKGYALPF